MLRIGRHIDKRQHGDREQAVVFQGRFGPELVPDEITKRQHQHADNRKIEPATGRVGDRGVRIHLVGLFKTLRSELVGPGKDERDRQPYHHRNDDEGRHPVRHPQARRDRIDQLDYEPAGNNIGDADPGHIAAL